jgi:HEAT repeat protein
MIRKAILLIFFLSTFPISVKAQDGSGIAMKYLLGDKNDTIRANAVRYLYDCREPECRKILLNALHDSSWLVRSRAIKALGSAADLSKEYIEALSDPNDMVWLEAINGLIGIGEQAKSDLYSSALSQDPFVRQGVVIALGIIGNSGSRRYSPISSFFESEIRCEAKGNIDKEAENILLIALQDEDPNVRRSATALFQCINSPAAVELLLQNTKDVNPDIKVAAIKALAGYSDSKIVPAAFKALKDSNPIINSAAMNLLLNMTGIDAVNFDDLLRDQDSNIRCRAFGLIIKLTNDKLSEPILEEIQTHSVALMNCGYFWTYYCDSKIIHTLLQIANESSDIKLISKISELIRSCYCASAIPLYLDAFQNSRHPEIRKSAANILLRQLDNEDIDKAILDAMRRRYDDSDVNVRSIAASFGARIKDKAVLPVLKQLATNIDDSMRNRALMGLKEFMPKVSDFLSSLLLRDAYKKNPSDIMTISEILNDAGKKHEVTSVLTTLINKNPESVPSALRSLYRIDPNAAFLQLKHLLNNGDAQIKMSAIESVKFIKHPKTIKAILGILLDEKEPEELRQKVMEIFQYSSILSRDGESKDAIYAFMKKESTPSEFKRTSAGALMSHVPGMSKDLLKDPAVCSIAIDIDSKIEVAAGDISLQGEMIKQRMFLSELEHDQTPRNCRIGIAARMKNIADPLIIEKMQALTSDKDPAIRSAVAATLGEISSSMMLPCLEKLLQDPDQDVREKAKAAISSINEHLQVN